MSENDIIAEYIKTKYPEILKTTDFAIFNFGATCRNLVDSLKKSFKNDFNNLIETAKKLYGRGERMDQCCGTCNYGYYDKVNGYTCVNPDSDYGADFVEYEHCCDEYEEK